MRSSLKFIDFTIFFPVLKCSDPLLIGGPSIDSEVLSTLGFEAELGALIATQEKYLTNLIASFTDGGEAHQENGTDESH